MSGASKVFKKVLDPAGMIFSEEKKKTPPPDYAAEQAKAEEAAEKKKKSMLNKGRSGTMLGGSTGGDSNLKMQTLNGSDNKPKKQKLGE